MDLGSLAWQCCLGDSSSSWGAGVRLSGGEGGEAEPGFSSAEVNQPRCPAGTTQIKSTFTVQCYRDPHYH